MLAKKRTPERLARTSDENADSATSALAMATMLAGLCCAAVSDPLDMLVALAREPTNFLTKGA